MRPLLRWMTLLLAVLLTAAACQPSPASPPPSPTAAAPAPPSAASPTPGAAAPIRIGAPFNLTGGMASIDVPAANGARLAAEEINATGGVLGHPLELLIRDRKQIPPRPPTWSPSSSSKTRSSR